MQLEIRLFAGMDKKAVLPADIENPRYFNLTVINAITLTSPSLSKAKEAKMTKCRSAKRPKNPPKVTR